MLTPLFRSAVVLNSYCFRFLPRTIISWDPKSFHIKRSNTSISTLWYWYTVILSSFLFGFCYVLINALVKYSNADSRPEKFRILVQVTVVSFTYCLCGLGMIYFLAGEEVAGAINQLSYFHSKIVQTFPVKATLAYSMSLGKSWEELFLNCLIVCMSVPGPLLITISSIYLKVDVPHLLLRDLPWLHNFFHSHFPNWFLILVVRFFPMFLGMLELGRIICISSLIGIYVLRTYHFILYFLLRLDHPQSLVNFYVQLRIIHQQLLVFGRMALSLVLTLGQVIIVQVGWGTVKGYAYLPFTIWVLYPIGGFYLVAVLVLFCQDLVFTHETSKILVGSKWRGVFKRPFNLLTRREENCNETDTRANANLFYLWIGIYNS